MAMPGIRRWRGSPPLCLRATRARRYRAGPACGSGAAGDQEVAWARSSTEQIVLPRGAPTVIVLPSIQGFMGLSSGASGAHTWIFDVDAERGNTRPRT